MATDSMMAGLFATPEQYQQAQRAQVQDQLAREAEMDPYAKVSYLAGMSGYGLGKLAGGLLGVEDPQMKLQSFRQQVLRGVDQTDPESLAQASYALNREGDTAGARQLAQLAQEAALKQSQITRNTREGRAAANKVVEANGRQYLVNSITGERIADLGSAANKGANIKEIGVAEGTRQPVYFDVGTDTQFVVRQDPTDPTKQVRVPFNGGVDRTTAKTNLGVKMPEGESEFVKRLGAKDADRVDNAITLRDTAVSSLNSLNKLATLPADQLISGQFATGRVGATNLLATLGLASPADVTRLSTSQQYQKVAGDVILQTLGGKLGSGFSNADREFIQGLIPQLETDPEARRKLIQFMQNKNQEIVQETIRLEDYARNNKGLKGYVPKIPLSVTPSSPNAAAGLTDAQLKAIAGIK
jgi:hypothetical protein